MNKLELLSPAGDLQIFKAAINCGADAVYFGGDLFGARAYAKNFSIEDAKEAINYAHLHGAKAYLTVNTLLKNLEIEGKLYEYLKAYVENGIDAFIVQDFGVLNFIRAYFPDTHIHVSTQASICTKYGGEFFENIGASRIVTAREISINEISKIHSDCPDLEIESFVHGALCVCYSGQCLMSSILGGRSGNRGRCAQPCRLPYEAYELNGKKIKSNGNYLLSPKDFCTIKYLPEMIDAGVISFKIEGRMKQLEYATGVLSVYRHYIDEYLYKGANNYSVSDKDIQRLLDAGNRSGFTDLYLHSHNGPEMITFEAPSHTKAESKLKEYEEKKITVNCKVKAYLGRPLSVIFTDENENVGEYTGDVIESANKRATEREDIEKAISGLGNTCFELNKLSIDYDDNIFLPVSALKNARREAISKLMEALTLERNPKILPFEEYKGAKNNSLKPDTFVTVSTEEQLFAAKDYKYIDSIGVPLSLFERAKECFNGKVYIYLPAVLRDDVIDSINIPQEADGVIAASYDELGFLDSINYNKDNIIIDHRLYTFNNRSVKAFDDLGYQYNCMPYELSLKELKHRDNHNSQLIIYSRIPMMITANCTVRNTIGCNKSNNRITLVDRKNENLIVACDCTNCYNTIYNSKKYIAFDLKEDLLTLGAKDFRIDFTVESDDEVREILNLYEKVFIKNEPFRFDEDFTKGHLKRGVE